MKKAKMRIDEYVRRARYLRAVDGDTVDVAIDLGWGLTYKERLRLLDVDTPEMRGPEREQGIAYRNLTDWWIRKHGLHTDEGVDIWIRSEEYDRGKYGRTLATIFAYDLKSNLNSFLVNKMKKDLEVRKVEEDWD